MSFVSANGHPDPVSPQDPLYYAPRSARGGVTESRPSAPQLAPSGNLPSDPRTSRFDEMREEAERVLDELVKDHVTEIKLLQEHLHDGLGQLIYDRTGRRPMILPVVVEV